MIEELIAQHPTQVHILFVVTVAFSLYGVRAFIINMKLKTLIPDVKEYWRRTHPTEHH